MLRRELTDGVGGGVGWLVGWLIVPPGTGEYVVGWSCLLPEEGVEDYRRHGD